MNPQDFITEKRVDRLVVGDLVLSPQGDWVVASIEPYGDRDLIVRSSAKTWALTCRRDELVDMIPKGKY